MSPFPFTGRRRRRRQHAHVHAEAVDIDSILGVIQFELNRGTSPNGALQKVTQLQDNVNTRGWLDEVCTALNYWLYGPVIIVSELQMRLGPSTDFTETTQGEDWLALIGFNPLQDLRNLDLKDIYECKSGNVQKKLTIASGWMTIMSFLGSSM